jgi:flagellin
MIINHNISSLNTYRQMSTNSAAQAKNMEKLSSGLRINKASDDAAGLAISEKMRGQIRGLEMASKNAQDGISFLQTAEGALNETHSILQRMRELSVQSSNDTNTDSDRAKLQNEVDQLAEEITRISNSTEFNGKNLINGGIKDQATGGLGDATFQIGSNAGQSISFSIAAMDAESLGVARDVTTYTGIGAGDIASASFGSTVGAKVDAGTLSFQYNNVTTASAGSVTGGANTAATTDLSVLNADATMKITIDGTDYTLNKTELNAGVGAGKTDTDLVAAINTKIGSAGTASIDGSGKLVITSATTGSTSNVSVDFSSSTAGDITTLQTAFGLTDGQSDTGQDVGKTVTISNGTTADDQVINITDETATSLTVAAGNYKGVTITTASTKTLADLDSSTDTVAVTATTTSSTAASFADGTTKDAVAAGGIDISSKTAASAAITNIDKAIETVSSERSKMGAIQNRLDHTINNLGTTAENLTAAESRIRDVDMAKEIMDQTKNSILSQAAQAMLAQANQAPQGVLQLLR